MEKTENTNKDSSRNNEASERLDNNKETNLSNAFTIAISLGEVRERLSKLENLSTKASPTPNKLEGSVLEIIKIIFSGWPALGFLFLVLFYSPLQNALSAIPGKIQNADEIGLLGISLKSTIKKEAAILGDENLSRNISEFSQITMLTLLKAPKNTESLISFTLGGSGEYKTINFPSKSMLTTLFELESNKLIKIRTDPDGKTLLTREEVRKIISKFKSQHPGKEESSSQDEEFTWQLNDQLPKDAKIPMLTWELTERGQNAIDIILKAVVIELTKRK